MRQALEKAKYILDEEGIITFFDRAIKILIVRGKRKMSDNKEDFSRWSQLKNKYQGQRAFLIGNGPSLNRLPLYLLRNEYSIGFNRINLLKERLNWLPSFYTTIDDRVLLDSVDEIKENISNYKYVFLPDLHPYNINFKKRFKNRENLFWLYLDKLDFSDNLPYAGINKTVANIGLQILAYLGFSKIYIIGVDLEYVNQYTVKKNNKRDLTSTKDDDPNHFDPRYFGSGRAYHQPRMRETFLRFEQAKMFFDKKNVQIFNAGIGGKLDVFPRVNFEDLFDNSEDQRKKLFLESCGFSSASDFEKKIESIPEISCIDKWNDKAETFSAIEEVGLKLINKVIFTHIPRGPYNGKYYFFKRKSNDN